MDNRMVGHLSIDSTIIEAREKPFVKKKEASPAPIPPKKKGRKKKGSPEEKALDISARLSHRSAKTEPPISLKLSHVFREN